MNRTEYYLAVDMGASSGRHMLAHMEEGRLVLEEVYRFENGCSRQDGHRVWDTEKLWHEILTGMKKCAQTGRIPTAMGIDTWGVDYVLLGRDDHLAAKPYAYRDARTQGAEEKVYEIIPEEELYARTGNLRASYNTIFQLMASKWQEPEVLDRAETFLMLPCYFTYLLTGSKMQEYTMATTGQLVDPETKQWDYALIDRLGLPRRLFTHLYPPGTEAGSLRPEVEKEVGFSCRVILPAAHDTASAAMCVPAQPDDTLYISSGTWSLMGCGLPEANRSAKAHAANFTNEGGYQYRFCFLKNIMGLWMIQSVRTEFKEGYTWDGAADDADRDYGYAHLCSRAEKETIASIVDVNDDRFLAPESMIGQVQSACAESGQAVPQSPWEIARVIYRSLAICYRNTAREIEEITGRKYHAIHIVGGGSNARWLNQLTADMTGMKVLAGPGEATAIGNIGAQMIADGVFPDLSAFQSCVYKSFGVETYLPDGKIKV
ncbi:MAG: rhamnulokinase [Lachnospiraceae bacterium]|jgi:rhamnulokinase